MKMSLSEERVDSNQLQSVFTDSGNKESDKINKLEEEKELEGEIEQEIEGKMNLENEIKNIHEYFTDDRRGSKRSQQLDNLECKKGFLRKDKKNKSRALTYSQEENVAETSQVIIEASVPKYKTVNSRIYYEVLIITNMKVFPSCFLRCHRRYSQFNELKRRVKKILSTTLEFPPKRWTLFGLSEKIKQERKNMLHPWIKYLFHRSIENEELMDELKKFVENENYPEIK